MFSPTFLLEPLLAQVIEKKDKVISAGFFMFFFIREIVSFIQKIIQYNTYEFMGLILAVLAILALTFVFELIILLSYKLFKINVIK